MKENKILKKILTGVHHGSLLKFLERTHDNGRVYLRPMWMTMSSIGQASNSHIPFGSISQKTDMLSLKELLRSTNQLIDVDIFIAFRNSQDEKLYIRFIDSSITEICTNSQRVMRALFDDFNA